ncbi:MAG: hypothetical protein FD165_1199 [Gammaproteobacteria bacterium]|nr:MAG: hypothetical protein FD165_1199 [Gammaproteobacteria bacterium]TND07358.1 MAG: hypothetical protein FD120_96 [Gammaproteobacteria bacterium]
MSMFINDAWAEATPAAAEPSLMSFVPLILIFLIFYFLLIRPQMKRAKDHRKMVETLAKHDEVVTSGGVLGRVVELGESFVTVEIADGVQIKVQRSAVGQLVPKGTYKSG